MSILDDPIFQESFMEQNTQSVPGTIIDELNREPYVGSWREFDKEKELPYATLKNLEAVANTAEWEKGWALNVVSRLYFFGSRVKIYQNKDGNSLLVLPDARAVIDLFNPTSNYFLGNNKEVYIDECINDILGFIGCEGFHFYFMRDAIDIINQISSIRTFPKEIIKKGNVIFQGTSYFGNNASESFLNHLFYGNHNWTSNSKGNLEYSLYPYSVICYESLAYIKDEKEYCIDQKTSLENIKIEEYLDNRQIALFARFSPTNPDAEGLIGETAIKFLGMYWLDRERSLEEKRLVFKYADDRLWV